MLKAINMYKRMTVTLDEAVYEGLYRTVGRRKISQFIEDLVRPHVLEATLDEPPTYASLEEGYKAMAADEEHEAEAQEWINAVIGDIPDEPW